MTISILGVYAAAASASMTVNGGKGADTINLVAGTAQNLLIDAGAGNDELRFTAGTWLTGRIASSVIAGAGADTIQLGVSGDSLFVDTGSENDLVNATGLFDGTTISGAAGADTITLNAAAGGVMETNSISGGAGNDLIQGNFFSANTLATSNTINGGAGTDTIIFGGTAGLTALSTVGAMSGNVTSVNATVIYGAGDVLQFQSTTLVTNSGNFNGGNKTVEVMTGLETVMTGLGIGDVAVYSDGTDTYFMFVTKSAVQPVTMRCLFRSAHLQD